MNTQRLADALRALREHNLECDAYSQYEEQTRVEAEADAALAAHEAEKQTVVTDALIDEAVNCAWHVAGTTLHSREDIKAAVVAIYPMFVGKIFPHAAEKAGPDERTCHAPGEKCYGCPHYYGRAASCVYKDAAPAQPPAQKFIGELVPHVKAGGYEHTMSDPEPPAPEPQGDFFSAAIRLLTESGCHDAADHLRTAIAALQQPVTLREVTEEDGDILRIAWFAARNADGINVWEIALRAILPNGIPVIGNEGGGA